jgi:hypothetical protein
MAARSARPPRRPDAGARNPVPLPQLPPGLQRWLSLPIAGIAAGIAMAVAAFLPWYGTNLGSPFTPSTTSGWNAGASGKAVLALGLAAVLVSLVLAADAAGALALDGGLRSGLRTALLACCAVAAALACYRLLVLPRPSGFFSRELGLYLALAAAAAGALVGVRAVAAGRAGG